MRKNLAERKRILNWRWNDPSVKIKIDKLKEQGPAEHFAYVDFKDGEHSFAQGDYGRALSSFSAGISESPSYPLFYWRGCCYQNTGKFSSALADFKQAIAFNASYSAVFNTYAWLLATCPDSRIRNGAEALKNGIKASAIRDADAYLALDTRAAAEAEVGDFKNAIVWEDRYLASSALTAKERVEGKARLALYERGKPVRDPS